jgi:hypothetical protein
MRRFDAGRLARGALVNCILLVLKSKLNLIE